MQNLHCPHTTEPHDIWIVNGKEIVKQSTDNVVCREIFSSNSPFFARALVAQPSNELRKDAQHVQSAAKAC